MIPRPCPSRDSWYPDPALPGSLLVPLSLSLQLHYLGLQLTVPETFTQSTEHRGQKSEHRGDGGRGLDTVVVSLCVDVRQRLGVVALQATTQLQLIPEAHTHTEREGGREGGRERGREGEREGEREGGREGGRGFSHWCQCWG